LTAIHYTVHGLEVHSDLELPLERGDSRGEPAVLIRRAGGLSVPDAQPPGLSCGTLGAPPQRVWWTLDGDAYRVRFGGLCELRLAPPWQRVHVDVDPAGAAEVIGDRIVRTALPFVLERLGHDLLHASAVRVGATTVAIAGASGTGKSTLAALLCADGGSLISDDQLRVEVAGDGVRCHPGLATIRLRRAVGEVAALMRSPANATWDGRMGVSPGLQSGTHDIDALLLPVLADGAPTPGVERLAPAQALMRLTSSRADPRDATGRTRRFHLHAALLERVPAFEVRLPRGSLPDRAFRRALLESAAVEAATR
jgi:hypothetical protein